MKRIILGIVCLLATAHQLKAQEFATINFTNTYTNTITTTFAASNFRSGFVHQSNGSINFGLTGLKQNNFRFRWLAHDNGAIDYTTDTDQLMFLDGNGNLNLKNNFTASGNIGIGTVATTDKVTIDMGATRGGFSMLSDGDAAAYLDMKFMVKNTTNLATGKPLLWEASLRKDGYFSTDLTGPTWEFYAVKKGGGYYAPLLFKSNGDLILAGASNATNGNVGIGTTDTEGYKLAVNGDAIFTKIKVKSYTAWPDYVFEEHYQLPSLLELEQFVKVNKHLPGMPVAEEVKKDGIDVEDMNRKLLHKVEELTLYLIDLKKENDSLKQQSQNQINELLIRIEKLEKNN